MEKFIALELIDIHCHVHDDALFQAVKKSGKAAEALGFGEGTFDRMTHLEAVMGKKVKNWIMSKTDCGKSLKGLQQFIEQMESEAREAQKGRMSTTQRTS